MFCSSSSVAKQPAVETVGSRNVIPRTPMGSSLLARAIFFVDSLSRLQVLALMGLRNHLLWVLCQEASRARVYKYRRFVPL